MNDADRAIARIVRDELTSPVPPPVRAIAEAARRRHDPAVRAILFYGSCFRDGIVEERLVDLYLIVESYRRAHRSRLAAAMNRLLPPNVYYVETTHEGRRVRAKYAVLSLDQLERRVRPDIRTPYFWARFAQPTGLVMAVDAGVEGRIEAALVEAVTTMAGAARRIAPDEADPLALWRQGFAATYRTELRAEKPHRAAEIVDHHPDRYRRLNAATAQNAASGPALDSVACRLQGKARSVLALIKAAFTFTGGADYLAWKIERHSGVAVALTPWQRRHPILASPPILWRLWRSRTVR